MEKKKTKKTIVCKYIIKFVKELFHTNWHRICYNKIVNVEEKIN